jgi:hypothetical protein
MTLREEQKIFKEACIIAKDYAGFPGISDIEFGNKHSRGMFTGEYSLRFKVKEKKLPSRLNKEELIPDKIGAFKTDVLSDFIKLHEVKDDYLNQTGLADKNSVVRPLIGGIQIQSGMYSDTINYWATVGFFYQYNNLILGFTNYHALYADLKPRLVQNEYVGKLPVYQNYSNQENKIGVAFGLYNQLLDYATFIVEQPVNTEQCINGLQGRLTSYVYPQINMPLVKSGAGSGITYGIIDGRSCLNHSEISIHLDTRYHYPDHAVSMGGDSGSLWLLNDGTNLLKPVALHYGGGETKQWAKAKSISSIFASIRNHNL